ncbi:hypothetical protein D3C87_1149490 [compost metagenome]
MLVAHLVRVVHQVEQQRAGNVVRQVADDAQRAAGLVQLAEVERQRVAGVHDQPVAIAAAQAVHEVAVQLHHLHLRQALEQRVGQRAEARADLDHDVIRLRIDRADDAVDDAVIDQKVLSESFAGHMALVHV